MLTALIFETSFAIISLFKRSNVLRLRFLLWLWANSPVVDADIIYQAGEESSCGVVLIDADV
jgi:hypothetical protein